MKKEPPQQCFLLWIDQARFYTLRLWVWPCRAAAHSQGTHQLHAAFQHIGQCWPHKQRSTVQLYSLSPATSSWGSVWIIWWIIATHKWATPHEWKCSKASAVMITVCVQVITLSPPHPLPCPWSLCRMLLLLKERIKVVRERWRGFLQGKKREVAAAVAAGGWV